MVESQTDEVVEFWNSTLKNSRWDELPSDIQDELYDYAKFMDKMQTLVYESSGWKLSKLTYTEDVYITAFNDYVEESVQTAIEEHDKYLLQYLITEIEEWVRGMPTIDGNQVNTRDDKFVLRADILAKIKELKGSN